MGISTATLSTSVRGTLGPAIKMSFFSKKNGIAGDTSALGTQIHGTDNPNIFPLMAPLSSFSLCSYYNKIQTLITELNLSHELPLTLGKDLN